jgi:hypothetical protein
MKSHHLGNACRIATSAVLLLSAAAPARGQAPPGTDIFLFAVSGSESAPRLSTPRRVTDRSGYDNQPSFTPDHAGLLYTSIRDDGQADTYRYDIATGSVSRVTSTAESEYSPTAMPGGVSFSAVRVEMDSTQRLWRFDLDGGNPTLILERVAPVGYHAWMDRNRVALFVLGAPPTLQMADVRTGQTALLSRDVGRSLHKVPNRSAVSFLQRFADGPWIVERDLESGVVRVLIRPAGQNEFFAWTPDGSILMGEGSVLFRWRDGGQGWVRMADLGHFGVTEISRVAVSGDGRWVAVVTARAEAER